MSDRDVAPERLLRDPRRADELLRWARRHNDPAAEALALARMGPEHGRWFPIQQRARRADDLMRDRIEAALEMWPDATREARVTAPASPELDALFLARRVIFDAPSGPSRLATSPHASQLTGATFPRFGHDAAWVCDVLADAGHLDALTALTFDEAVFDEAGIDALGSALAALGATSLTLRRTPLDADALARLARHPGMGGIDALTLEECAVDEAGLDALLSGPFAPRLRTLGLAMNDLDAVCSALAAADHVAGLERLELGHNPLDDLTVAPLAEAAHLRGLRHLDLSAAYLEDPAVLHAVLGTLAPSLESLRLELCELTDDHAEILALAPFERLDALHLGDNVLGPRGLCAIASASALGALRDLDVSSATFDSAVAAAWSSGGVRGLERLRLVGCQLDGNDVRGLSAHGVFRRLRDLDLAQNAIGPEGLDALLAGVSPESLRRLVLDGVAIGDAGAATMARAPSLAGVQHLSLRGSKIGDTGALALGTSPVLSHTLRYRWLSQLTGEVLADALRARGAAAEDVPTATWQRVQALLARPGA